MPAQPEASPSKPFSNPGSFISTENNPCLCAYSFEPDGALTVCKRARRALPPPRCPLSHRVRAAAATQPCGSAPRALTRPSPGHGAAVHPRAALEFVRQQRASRDQGWSWVHLKRDHELLPDWFSRVASLPDDAVYELTTDDSQPHCTTFSPGKTVVLRLRGLRRRISNAAEALAEVEDGAFMEDLFSITLLVQPDKVLSTADTSLECVRQMREQLSDSIRAGEVAFPNPGAFVSQLVEYVIDDALKLVNGLQDSLDAFEERDEESNLGGDGDQQQRLQDKSIKELGSHRRTAVKLRRWVGPQREVLKDLTLKGAHWLFLDVDEAVRQQLRSNTDSSAHLLEALEAIREHSAVLKDELSQLQQRGTNHALYLLSVVSALFLPFTFVTGLLSMSVDGIPGSHTKWAFYAVAAGCVILLVSGALVFRRLRWM